MGDTRANLWLLWYSLLKQGMRATFPIQSYFLHTRWLTHEQEIHDVRFTVSGSRRRLSVLVDRLKIASTSCF